MIDSEKQKSLSRFWRRGKPWRGGDEAEVFERRKFNQWCRAC